MGGEVCDVRGLDLSLGEGSGGEGSGGEGRSYRREGVIEYRWNAMRRVR